MTSSGVYQALERRGLAADVLGLATLVLRHTWAHTAAWKAVSTMTKL